MFEFFIVAGEAWFLCNGLELYSSITNPFSNFQSRIKMYHIGVWSVAVLFTLFPFILNMYHSIYGFWYVSEHRDESAICWLKVTNVNKLGYPLWFLFVMPLLFVYVFCVLTIVYAFLRLQRGLTRSFLPRLRLLVANTANVVVLSFYWSCFFLIYAWTFFTRHDIGSFNSTLFNILTFTIGSKGVASLISWIFVTDAIAFLKTDAESETVDANKALREEVLSFATAGIRSTARAGSSITPEQPVIRRRPIVIAHTTKNNKINGYFFIRFMMGETEEVAAIREMANQKRRSLNSSFVRYSSLHQPTDQPSISEQQSVSHPNARLSQRATVISGTEAMNKLTMGTIGGGAAGNNPRESDMESGGKPSLRGMSMSEVTCLSESIANPKQADSFLMKMTPSDYMQPVNESMVNAPQTESFYTKCYNYFKKYLDIDQA
jgi:hypothetical protein